MNRKSDCKCGLLLLICLSILLLSMDTPLWGETRRAFLVGINQYELPANRKLPQCRKEGLANLHGCLNDVEVMKNLLQSRFQFEEKNIKVLIDQDATQEGLLKDFKKVLIDTVSPGDTCLFYFSGHGSWMPNSLSTQSNKRDETLVPFDWFLGHPDIRDKELKELFNEVLDKKAHLTVIVDACHSGSISRGIQDLSYRLAPPNACDAAQPPDGKPDPASRGAVILAAAQEFQLASEIIDENQRHRGLFSWALTTVLTSCSTDEAIGDLLLRVDGLMQSQGRDQWVKLHYPSLEAREECRQKRLFDTKPGEDLGLVLAVEEVKGKRIWFQGGLAAGIREKCQLQKINRDHSASEVRVEVTGVTGLNRCEAKVLAGDGENIKRGDLFKIYKWVIPRETRMKVWMPAAPYSQDELLAWTQEIKGINQVPHLLWVQEGTKQKPTHRIYWDESSWWLLTPGNKKVRLGKRPNRDAILQAIHMNPRLDNGEAVVLLQLPLSAPLQQALMAEMGDYQEAVAMVGAKDGFMYMLAGREVMGRIEYAWQLPEVMEDKTKGFALPVGTHWLAPTNMAEGLTTWARLFGEMLQQLVKVRGWLQLQPPPTAQEQSVFPYQLVLQNSATGEYKTTGPLREGESYGLVLRAQRDMATVKKERRFVYVFLIDSLGDSTLLFPRKERFSAELYFPATEEWPEEIPLGEKDLFTISAPLGLDTYILLTTAERISHWRLFEFEGLWGEARDRSLSSSLEGILYGLSAGTRSGDSKAIPLNWCIQRLPIWSVAGE